MKGKNYKMKVRMSLRKVKAGVHNSKELKGNKLYPILEFELKYF